MPGPIGAEVLGSIMGAAGSFTWSLSCGLVWRMLWLQPETNASAAANAAMRAIAFIAYSSMSAVPGPKAILRHNITAGRNLGRRNPCDL
jgi:hypothetical protein